MKELHVGNKLFGSKVALLKVFVIPSWDLNAQKGIKAELQGYIKCDGWLTCVGSFPEERKEG